MINSSLLNTIFVLVLREFQRIKSEPSRLAGIALQPLLFWCIFSLGFNNNFSYQINDSSISYQTYFYPGILGLVLLFSSIYSTLTLVEDKKCGFFKFIICSPAKLSGAIIGKLIATSIIGFCQSLLFLPFMFLLPNQVSNITSIILLLFFGSVIFSILGIIFAIISPSSSAFHALMSIILIPMWLLSGSMFPLEHTKIKFILLINPMSYLVSSLRVLIIDTKQSLIINTSALMIFLFLLICVLVTLIRKKSFE